MCSDYHELIFNSYIQSKENSTHCTDFSTHRY